MVLTVKQDDDCHRDGEETNLPQIRVHQHERCGDHEQEDHEN